VNFNKAPSDFNELKRRRSMKTSASLCILVAPAFWLSAETPNTSNIPKDPGVRTGPAAAGGPLPGLSSMELAFFNSGSVQFQQVDSVRGNAGIAATDNGLGPAFNLDSCGGCHAQPAVGGSSPKINPQVAMASKAGSTNTLPSFIVSNGPVREARFKFNADGSRDGGVHNLYTITGRVDALGCQLAQPDFARALQADNVVFRIPTPTFGAGLIEAIPDSAILANAAQNSSRKASLGISGHPNMSGNDGTITRFGWKAQNKSLTIFAGEAYNVEQGVTNEVFPQERNSPPASCLYNPTPESGPDPTAANTIDGQSDVAKFAAFMRFLAPPAPTNPASTGGDLLFASVGCSLCHTPALETGSNANASLSYKQVNLFSDLLVHHMGSTLADNILQGAAGADEFRTAPLWGLGQRIFFLHDGRTADLLEAIRDHASSGSEANEVIDAFNKLPAQQRQAIVDFLRSL
jgi:CxxC motif-containing protein (DUF1111 family)